MRCLIAAGLIGLAACASAQKLIVGYMPNWLTDATVLDKVDFSKLTHVNVAFENPVDDEGNLSFNPMDQKILDLARKNGVKCLISIGGGGAPDDKDMVARFFALESDAKRPGFVAKLTDYVVAHGFDGLDVDIEGPMIGDDYGKLIVDLAKSLHAKGKLLSAAVSQGYGGDHVSSSCLPEFDFVNVMAYDGTGPWDPNHGGPHSSFEMAKQNLDYFCGRGLPKAKAVLGVPFYGYGFGKDFTSGGYSFADILTKYPGSEKVDQIGETIYYNGIPTIKAKAQYILDQGYGGIMIWSLDQDAFGEDSLLAAIASVLRAK